MCNSLGQQDGRRMGNVAGLLSVSFRPLTDLEGRAHVELPVHALLPWPEVGGRRRQVAERPVSDANGITVLRLPARLADHDNARD